MKKEKIISEILEILLIEDEYDIHTTEIEFDSMSSLLLMDFLATNFNITITKNEIKNFKNINDIIIFINND